MSSGSAGPSQSASSVAADAPTEPLGRLRDYELLEKLGQGGMGTVYKARHLRLEKLVAVKVLPQERLDDEASIARFNREMRAVGTLQHPNIVQAHDAGEESGQHYLVMEYIDGIDLGELSKRLGPLPIADACALVRQAAVGLQYAHSHGLVHRDIKPANLLLSVSNRPSAFSDSGISGSSVGTGPQLPEAVVKILDLGLALLGGDRVDDELTSTGQIMGTLDYVAPEQLADTHRVDIRADIYSLGCTLYRLLAGVAPFGYVTSPLRKIKAHDSTPVPPIQEKRDDVPAELAAVLDRMLAKQPDDRYQTPADVVVALEPLANGHRLTELWEQAQAAKATGDTKVTNTKSPVSGPLTDTMPPQTEGSPHAPREESRAKSDRPNVSVAQQSNDAAAGGTPHAEREGDTKEREGDIEAPVIIPVPEPSATSLFPKSGDIGQLLRRVESRRGQERKVVAAIAGLIGVALVAVGWMYGGQVIRIVTGKGVLVIEAADHDFEVTIRQGQTVIRDKAAEREYVLKEGEGYLVEVTERTSGLSFNTKQFSITRGGKRVLDVRHELAALEKRGESSRPARRDETPKTGDPHAEREGYSGDLAEPPPLEEWLKGREVLTVKQDGTADFTTIQAALDALKPGQVVRLLDKGPYRESLWLHDPPDQIGIVSDVNTAIEVDEWRTIDWMGKSPVGHFFANAKYLRVSGIDFVFRRDSGHGILWSKAGVFENCTFHATKPPTQEGAWLHFSVLAAGSNPIQFTLRRCSIVGRVNMICDTRLADLTLEENVFHGYPAPPLSISGKVGRFRIRNNILHSSEGIGLFHLVQPPKSLLITNNTLSFIGFNRSAPESGITIRNNLISDAIWFSNLVSENEVRRAASFEIGHNSYLEAPQPNARHPRPQSSVPQGAFFDLRVKNSKTLGVLCVLSVAEPIRKSPHGGFSSERQDTKATGRQQASHRAAVGQV